MKLMSRGGCRRPGLWLAAITLSLAACMPRSVSLDMRYPEGAVGESSAATTRACSIKIDSITDARGNKQTLGHIGNAPVFGNDIEDWVRRGLADLQVLGYQVVDTGAVSQPLVRMDVSLKQAYVRNVNTSLESVMRLTVHYTRSNGSVVERSYRGGHARIHWVAATNEYMGALNHAMIGAVRDIAKDLPELCGT